MSALTAVRGMVLSESIEDYPEGIILPIDKPYRWTSADVIRKVKWAACRHFHKKNLKVGHAGTLDPLATGVLLVCIGPATRLAEQLQKSDKQYLAGVTFGATTPSYDREKDIDRSWPVEGISECRLREVLPGFLGEQEQVAPLFSAKSVDGVRAYELARRAYRDFTRKAGAGQASLDSAFDHSASELLSRQIIRISDLEIVSYSQKGPGYPSPVAGCTAEAQSEISAEKKPERLSSASNRINVAEVPAGLPEAEILVTCSKGTYIRALARDLGEALDSGAFLHSLRRTCNGGFRVEEALSVEDAITILSR